jgi:long-subunit acyl-CoA synthetase (AMP-forming)
MLPSRVGLLFAGMADYMLADLALSFAGKELVPLPPFFSDAQLAHIVQNTRLEYVLCDALSAPRARKLGLIAAELGAAPCAGSEPASEALRVIFTSGSTGQPKGVRLSSRQILASVAALAEATGARTDDRYLSVLPNALLLEQIAGIYLPLLVGGQIHLPVLPSGRNQASLAEIIEGANPTATVLVPDLLAAWLRELQSLNRSAPKSIRYIAVGGAPVSKGLLASARQCGLPVHEGYGLSECCSVVTLNRPGDQGTGTAGRPLTGTQVTIDNGEIIVSGPTVMDGYFGETDIPQRWATGDLGRIDPEGRLIVEGRKDNLIITAAGRNVSPEWIEDMIASDRRVQRCVVVEHEGVLVAVVTPAASPIGSSSQPALGSVVADATRYAPDYAKPSRCMVVTNQEVFDLDLLTPNGRPRRAAIRRLVGERSRSLCGQLN